MYSIGVDLGGTNIAAGLVGDDYKIILKKSVPTRAEREADAISADIAALCKALIEEKGISSSDVAFVGIASPGAINDRDGIVDYANNLPFKHYPIADKVAQMSGISKVYLANDANAAALGETMAGAARGASSSVMITLGTGVGGGIVIDGKIYSGFNGAGGELGHTVIEYNGRQCTCGRRGCWETYSSATGLIKTTKNKLDECRANNVHTVMFDDEEKGHVNGRTAFNGMRAGDKAATEVVNEYVSYLACGIANIINIFQPEIITIGGGISNERDYLLNLLVPLVHDEQYSISDDKRTKIKIAELGNDAGIVGASVLGK